MEEQLTEEQKEERTEYVNGFLKRLEKKPGTLTKHETRLGGKFKGAKAETSNLEQNINQMRDQIKQAEASIRSMEIQLQTAFGRANGFLESILEIEMMKREEEAEAEAAKQREEAKGMLAANDPEHNKTTTATVQEAQPEGDLPNEDAQETAVGSSDYVDPATGPDAAADRPGGDGAGERAGH